MRLFACAKQPFVESVVRLASFKYFAVLMLLTSNACDVSATLARVLPKSLVQTTRLRHHSPNMHHRRAGKKLFGTTPSRLTKADILACNRDRRIAAQVIQSLRQHTAA